MKNIAFLALILTIMTAATPMKIKSVHEFKVKSIEGKEVSLSMYKGKKLLIVNVASECGYTPQYAELETLWKKYGDKLVVLGFPANNFGAQEPGTNSEIKSFCTKNYGVTFPMFEKISVVGADQHPLYQYLSHKDQNGKVGEKPNWNFSKYLVDEDGKVIKFFAASVTPMSPEIINLLK